MRFEWKPKIRRLDVMAGIPQVRSSDRVDLGSESLNVQPPSVLRPDPCRHRRIESQWDLPAREIVAQAAFRTHFPSDRQA